MYQARILDKDRQLKAILPGVRWHYTRRINEATDVSIYIPRETIDEVITQDHPLYGFFGAAQPVVVEGAPKRERDNKPAYAAIASYVQIYQGDKLRASGKIVGRDLGRVVTVHAMTEEILLEANLTPAQYGKVWDGWDLADVARDLLDGWQSIRIKDQSQWQSYMVDSSHVDLTTEPGMVMLAKDSSGKYRGSGYITLKFEASEVQDYKRWDRIRWSADSEDPVKTTIQYSYDGTNWSAEFDGGLPEEIGLVPNFGTQDTVYVRINLYTNDTESEDPEGNPVGVTPVVFAVELIARTEGALVAGNIPDVAGVTVKGIEADHASAFQVLLNACEQNGWEFRVVNGALSIAENLGTDRTKDFVLRAGTNMEITSLGDDDGELCNILTAYGPGSGINRMEITLRDEDSIAQFGPYPKAMEFEAETLAELEQKAQEYLDSHNTPTVAFEVAAVFDFEHEPEYGLGDVVRVADPDTGIVTTARIMSETMELAEDGLSVHLALGKAGLNLQSVLEGKERLPKPLDPLTPTGVYARGIIKGIVVGCSAPKTDWAYTECHVSTAKGFVPGSATLVDKGKQTRFDIPNLDPGVRYYARLIHVDSSGRRSEPSREVSAAAQYIPVDALPDYSIGMEKFMENIKPPIMVSSLPVLPDPRYTVGTTVFLITDKKLYSTDGNTWEPVGAGTVTPDEIVAGIITAGGIKADWYADIRNVLPFNYLDSLDSEHSLVCDFHVPTATVRIVEAKLSVKGLPFRAYARSARFWDWPLDHTGGVTFHSSMSLNYSSENTGSTNIDHSHSYDRPASNTSSAGGHSHSISNSNSNTGSNSGQGIIQTGQSGSWSGEEPAQHSHSIGGFNGAAPQGHTHSYISPPNSTDAVTGHTHSVGVSSGTTSSDGGTHSHSYSRLDSISNLNNHTHELDISHEHGLEFGIHEDTTPADVTLEVNNGDGWSPPIPLGSGSFTHSELDISDYINGTGWKQIRFKSSRLGRINAQLILKIDLTA